VDHRAATKRAERVVMSDWVKGLYARIRHLGVIAVLKSSCPPTHGTRLGGGGEGRDNSHGRLLLRLG